MRNKNDYHEDWVDTIRPQALKHYKYRCVDCGIKHKTWVAVKKGNERIEIDKDEITDYTTNGWKCYRIYLHVCHEDNDKTNNDVSNLKVRCVTHHAIRDGQYKALLRLSNTKKKTRVQLNIIDEIQIQEEKNTMQF